eukprot:6047498-Amphidinium_carterae.1
MPRTWQPVSRVSDHLSAMCPWPAVSIGQRHKLTPLMASDAKLLQPCRELQCQCVRPHVPLAGTETGIPFTEWAARSPRNLCQRTQHYVAHVRAVHTLSYTNE